MIDNSESSLTQAAIDGLQSLVEVLRALTDRLATAVMRIEGAAVGLEEERNGNGNGRTEH